MSKLSPVFPLCWLMLMLLENKFLALRIYNEKNFSYFLSLFQFYAHLFNVFFSSCFFFFFPVYSFSGKMLGSCLNFLINIPDNKLRNKIYRRLCRGDEIKEVKLGTKKNYFSPPLISKKSELNSKFSRSQF